jgi:hypothetical protein
MSSKRQRHRGKSLADKYPPSPSCGCEVCRSFCARPGWWTVREAASAMAAGYANRMMLEVSPERDFGVLSPAFQGCEGDFAIQEFSDRGCNFLVGGLCELHGTGLQPLECRFCHHERSGWGETCHADLEKDWNTHMGQQLVMKWGRLMYLEEIVRRVLSGTAEPI